MKKISWFAAALALGVGALISMVMPARALSVGDTAPDFSADSTVGGKITQFHLKDALAKHAILLYFFPKAFTAG